MTMKLSVLLITYNHKRYIAQAIESVLAQQVSFPIEIIVADDCSTDGTAQVVAEYANLHPTQIRAELRDRNVGGNRNFLDCLRVCKGQYVAVLDGDDYWTDIGKLATQVAFLDANPQTVICGHQAIRHFEDGSRSDHVRPTAPIERAGLTELLRENPLPACSVVFRNGIVQNYPDWLLHTRMADWPFYILHCTKGSLTVLDRCMGVYRVHRDGLWGSASARTQAQACIEMFGYVRQHVGREYDDIIDNTIRGFFVEWGHAEYEDGNLREARKLFWKGRGRLDGPARRRLAASYIPKRLLALIRRMLIGRASWTAQESKWTCSSQEVRPVAPQAEHAG